MPQENVSTNRERVSFICKQLAGGNSREEIAKMLGYKGWRSLDIFMRRQGLQWDSRNNRYFCKEEKSGIEDPVNPHTHRRISAIISKFDDKDADPFEVAKQLGFNDHRQLSVYMASRGYHWNVEGNNYVQFSEQKETSTKQDLPEESEGMEVSKNLENRLERNPYDPLFNILLKNKERLLELLLPASSPGCIPRYTVPGITRTKSFYMSDQLSKLICEFSEVKNISQKEIIETALIEFFKNYSFDKQVNAIIGKG